MSRLPERDRRQDANGKRRWRPSMPNWLIALLFLLVFTVGPYLAFTKHIPFTGYGYELHATFANSDNIALNSPVRIAGVEVGKVISTERDGDATKVTFTVSGSGRPVHDDAFAAIRPRIFLEGNFFIDLNPGSPSAPDLDSGDTIPISRTSTAVQIDEVLTALQSPVRADLGRLLESYGTALAVEPSAEEDLDQLPEVKGLSGGQALNLTFKYGGEAGRYTSQVANALLGTKRGDLPKLVAGTGKAFDSLSANQAALQGLIVNFEEFTGALAQQSGNVSTTIRRLDPTLGTARRSLVALDETFPPLRTYAIVFKPAVEELPALIRASKPWIAQVRPLLSAEEAGGDTKLLAEATPGLNGAARAGKAVGLPALNQLSLCATQVLIPTSEQTINDRFSTGGPNYREFMYLLTNIAGSAQNFDGNGPYLRANGGGGGVLVGEPNPTEPVTSSKTLFAHTAENLLGVQPQLGSQPPLRPNVRCDTNQPPELNGPLSKAGAPSPSVAGVK